MPTNSDFFAKYKNPVFVETGSFRGDGIQAAIDAGFGKVHSIELSEHYYSYCRGRFAVNPKVNLYLGDSAKMLRNVISAIDLSITFWLDGHYSHGDTALGNKYSPLMDELAIIADHPIKTHTILIDDLRCWNVNDLHYQFGLNEIKNKIQTINPEYKFSIEDSTAFEQDVLVAIIETGKGEAI